MIINRNLSGGSSVKKWIELFCRKHPYFGIPNLMKYITIALAALSVISAVTNSRTESSYLWGIVMVGCQLLEFLFLYRIYKGFEFKS